MENKIFRLNHKVEPSIGLRIQRVVKFISQSDEKYTLSKFLYKATITELTRIEKLINKV